MPSNITDAVGGGLGNDPLDLGNAPTSGVPSIGSAVLPPVFLSNFADYDTSTVAYLFQGDTRATLEGALSADAAANIAGANIVFAPRYAPIFGTSAAASLSRSAMTISTITNLDGTTSTALFYTFPAGWGNTQLPAGDWLAYAIVTYSDGSSETLAMNAVLRVQSLIPVPPLSFGPSADFVLGQGDTLPSLLTTLEDGNGSPVNLTGAAILFRMARTDNGVALVSRSCALVNAVSGQVRFDWQAADTASPGLYQGDFFVTFPDMTTETFPKTPKLTILVTPAV